MLKLCSSVEAIRTTCAMAMMFTLQLKFELSTIPSIPSNGNVGGLLFLVLSKLLSRFFFMKTHLEHKFLSVRPIVLSMENLHVVIGEF